MKNCSLCNIVQPNENFGTIKNRNNVKNSWCKKCVTKKTLAYKRTPKGLIQQIYKFQIESAKRRKQNLPTYSREWLLTWLINQENFKTLFNNWGTSGYLKDLIPSIDRLNDNISYTKNNIQLLTWKENNDKGHTCYLNGKLGRKVDQLDLKGNLIKQWPNISMPAHSVNCTIGEITRVCKGKRNTCRNFKWKYSDG